LNLPSIGDLLPKGFQGCGRHELSELGDVKNIWLLSELVARLATYGDEDNDEPCAIRLFTKPYPDSSAPSYFPNSSTRRSFARSLWLLRTTYGLKKAESLDLLLDVVMCIGLALGHGLGESHALFDFGDTLVVHWGRAKREGKEETFMTAAWPPCSVEGPRTAIT
jgi:hypothetical protein